ncbi:hypothetical protein JL721_11583 [Aureococcus anophagefferens]|nr:hypothetical protein JL721_11583 [Aureococcus anophagefferens]
MSLALSPDALSIAVASASRLSVHGASAGSRERQYVQQGQLARRYACCAWSKDAALVACGSGDGAVVVWDVKRGLLYACYALPGGAFARHVARWAVAGGEPAAWDGDKRGVSALAAHPSGGAVAVGSTRVRLLQTTGTGAKRALAGTHATEVRRLAWTASGRYVVSLARDARSVLVHDCTKAKDGVWSLRLAAPGLEVCARAAPRAEGEEAVEVAAVRCGDDALLETVLRRTEPATVAATCAKLAPSLALPTLDALAARLERSPLRAADLAGWVKALLLQHASHLATLPKLADTLARLQYVVDARVAALPKFLSLLGKFDLLLHKKTGAAVSGAASAEVTPLNVVAADATDDDDDDDDDDDMEEDDDDDDDESEEEDDDDGDGVVGRRRGDRRTHEHLPAPRIVDGERRRPGGARRGLFVGE